MITPFLKSGKQATSEEKGATILVFTWISRCIYFVATLAYLGAAIAFVLLPQHCNLQSIVLYCIENSITLISIIISWYATQITNRQSKAIEDRLRSLCRQNEPLFCKTDIKELAEKTQNNTQKIAKVQRVLIGLFAMYCFCVICYFVAIQQDIWASIASLLSAVSAVCSIVLGVVSMWSCFYTNKYLFSLIESALIDFRRLTDELNDLRISTQNE